MYFAKLFLIAIFIAVGVAACATAESKTYVISESRDYEASLFRQNCAICHGPEGEGRTLEDGTVVPSLRTGEFKKRTDTEIYDQIANGGNGMLPFRKQLTESEIRQLVRLIQDELRSGEK